MYSLFCASGISKSISSNACSLALRKLCEDASSFIHEPQNLEILFWISEVTLCLLLCQINSTTIFKMILVITKDTIYWRRLYPYQIILLTYQLSIEKVVESIFIDFTSTSPSSYSLRGDHRDNPSIFNKLMLGAFVTLVVNRSFCGSLGFSLCSGYDIVYMNDHGIITTK